jgi:hypothetical protein
VLMRETSGRIGSRKEIHKLQIAGARTVLHASQSRNAQDHIYCIPTAGSRTQDLLVCSLLVCRESDCLDCVTTTLQASTAENSHYTTMWPTSANPVNRRVKKAVHQGTLLQKDVMCSLSPRKRPHAMRNTPDAEEA